MSHHDTAMAIAGPDGPKVTMVWPSTPAQMANYFVFALSLTVNSVIVGRRLHRFKVIFLGKWSLDSAWISEAALLFTFANSAGFVAIAGALQYGVGLSHSTICNGAIITCVSAYAMTKVFIYLFFLERVFIVAGASDVHIPLDWASRKQCKPWIFGALLYMIGIPCVILLGVSGRWRVDDDMVTCHIGVHTPIAVPLIIWDVIINAYLSINFVLPLLRFTRTKSADIRSLTIRTLIASAVSTVSSSTNLIVLLVLQMELGWICLISCAADVLVNTVALALVTTASNDRDGHTTTGTPALHSSNQNHRSSQGNKEIRVTRHELREFDAIEMPEAGEGKAYVRKAGAWGGDVKGGDAGAFGTSTAKSYSSETSEGFEGEPAGTLER